MNKFVLLVLALASIAAVSAGGLWDLESYCKGDPIELNKVGDLQTLIKLLKDGPAGGCSGEARNAVLDLEPIIMADNVCSVEVAKRIGRYYETYVSKKNILRNWSLSKYIKDYFLAVGFKISKLCDKSLMINLPIVGEERVSREDADALLDFNQAMRDRVRAIAGSQSRIEDLYLVTNMDGIKVKKSERVQDSSRQVVVVDAETKKQVDQIKALCRNKFKPIYEELISPLVILTNVGFEYTSGDVQELKSDFRREKLYLNWFSAVLICESTLGLKMIEVPKRNEIESNGVTDQDLAKLKEEDVDRVEAVEPEAAAGVPQEYKVNVKLLDWVNLKQDELLKEVKTISKKRREVKSSRKQALKRLEKMLQNLSGSKEFKVGLEESETETGNGEPIQPKPPTGTRVFTGEPRKHWVKKTIILLGIGLMLIGGFGMIPPVFWLGVGLLAGMAGLRAVTTRDQWSNDPYKW